LAIKNPNNTAPEVFLLLLRSKKYNAAKSPTAKAIYKK
jgi:hypothetical protein